MTEVLSASERYLQQLADGLEALGPTETGEVLAEVRSHLADAVTEVGDEREVLARFGSPELLATRLLEERGVIISGPAVPAVTGPRQWAALGIDVALWALLVWLIAIPFLGVAYFTTFQPWAAVVAWTALAAVVAVSAWWWLKKRHEHGYVSTGMKLMGLRRIRVGRENRLVRTKDIPGVSRGTRVTTVLGVACACLILAFMSYAVISSFGANRQMQIQSAVRDSSTGVAIISELYRMVGSGSQPGELEGLFAPAAMGEAAGLVARHREGRVDSYVINGVELLAYTPESQWGKDATTTPAVVVSVGVDEYAAGSETSERFEYRVAMTTSYLGEGAWAGQWSIQSVERSGQ